MITYEIRAELVADDAQYALSLDGTLQNLGTPNSTGVWTTKENGDPITGNATYRVYFRYNNEDWKEDQYEDVKIGADPFDTDLQGKGLYLADTPNETSPTEFAAYKTVVVGGLSVRQLVRVTAANLSAQITRAYTHTQSQPANVWVINHNMKFRPGGIQVFDSAGAQWWGFGVSHPTADQTILTFGPAFGGTAYLS